MLLCAAHQFRIWLPEIGAMLQRDFQDSALSSAPPRPLAVPAASSALESQIEIPWPFPEAIDIIIALILDTEPSRVWHLVSCMLSS